MGQHTNPPDATDLLEGFARGLAALYKLKPVFPLYMASRAKKGLLDGLSNDPEAIIRSVGEIETVGDCKYAITVTDVHSQTYRITVEVCR